MPAQVRSITFTKHVKDLTEEELEEAENNLKLLFDLEFPTKYWCMGKELGTSGLTPHWQGFASFKKRVSFIKLGKALKCHIEPAHGTIEQNVKYCSKENLAFLEFGTYDKDKDKKFDYADALRYAREGRVEDIALEAPLLYLRYRPQLERVQQECNRPLPRLRRGIWLVGSPRTGKSYFASRYSNNGYIKAPNKWWDTYTDQDTVIINDIDESNAAKLAYYLKIWADPYSLLVEVKGSMVYIDPSVIIVTSNYRINSLYRDFSLQTALHERFMEITVLDWRETPIGQIEIKTHNPHYGVGGEVWLNQTNILSYKS